MAGLRDQLLVLCPCSRQKYDAVAPNTCFPHPLLLRYGKAVKKPQEVSLRVMPRRCKANPVHGLSTIRMIMLCCIFGSLE